MKRQPMWKQAKWRWSIWLLLIPCLLAAFLAGCASEQAPSAYVWTDAGHFVTLTWQNQNGSLSGEYTSISYADVAFSTNTAPDVVTIAYTGSELGNAVTLDIGGERVTGTLAPDSSQLSVTFVDTASGQAVHQTWVAVATEEQSQLVAAFSAYHLVQGWLDVAKRDAAGANAWSDPNTASLALVRQSVNAQQAELTAIGAAPDELARCQLVARFQPIASSAFTLPVTEAQDGTLHDAAMLSQAWHTAQRAVIPHLAGLALPWVIAPSVYQHATVGITALAARLHAAYRQDAMTMRHLQQQDRHVAQQVTVLDNGCPPMPA